MANAPIAIATIIARQFDKLDLSYPVVSEKQKKELQKVKTELLEEESKPKKKK